MSMGPTRASLGLQLGLRGPRPRARRQDRLPDACQQYAGTPLMRYMATRELGVLEENLSEPSSRKNYPHVFQKRQN
jgi:hypothetical protein